MNDIKAKIMKSESNTVLLAGIKKSSVKLQKDVDSVRSELNKFGSTRQKEEDEHKLIVDDYKIKVSK